MKDFEQSIEVTCESYSVNIVDGKLRLSINNTSASGVINQFHPDDLYGLYEDKECFDTVIAFDADLTKSLERIAESGCDSFEYHLMEKIMKSVGKEEFLKLALSVSDEEG